MGWIHLWLRREDFESGEASVHFFNGRVDPLWQATPQEASLSTALDRGDLVELEDPGYLSPGDETGTE